MSLSHLSVAPYGEDQPDTESTSETVDPQQQVLTLKKKLEEAVGEVVRLQSGIRRLFPASPQFPSCLR